MFSLFVLAQILPRPAFLFAEITWDGDPLQMVGLNVITYVPGVAFLSTNIANSCRCQSASALHHMLTFMHHRFYFLIKLMYVIGV